MCSPLSDVFETKKKKLISVKNLHAYDGLKTNAFSCSTIVKL